MTQKGGSGKTTISVHLLAYARSQGLDAALVDLDPQASALNWNSKREPTRQFPAYDKLPAPKGLDLVIIDTPPHSDRTAAMAAAAADFVLIPFRPAQFDMDALPSTLEICRLAKRKCAVVLNAVPHNNRTGQEAQESLREDGVPLLPVQIINRVAFSHAVIDGRAVHEFEPEGKAAREIAMLYTWIQKEMRL
jgi:chromosome partitioning protein